MQKIVKKKGRVRHLPDSCLYTSLERKERGERMKYKEPSANTMAFISCRLRLTDPAMSTDLSQVGVALFPSF